MPHAGMTAVAGLVIVAAVTGCSSSPGSPREEPYCPVYGIERGGGETESVRTDHDAVWQAGAQSRVTLEGQVRDITRVSPAGPPYDHTLVTLRLADGHSRVVDLGPLDSRSDLPLLSGEAVAAEGRMSARHGQWVLVAERIRIGGRWVDLPEIHHGRPEPR